MGKYVRLGFVQQRQQRTKTSYTGSFRTIVRFVEFSCYFKGISNWNFFLFFFLQIYLVLLIHFPIVFSMNVLFFFIMSVSHFLLAIYIYFWWIALLLPATLDVNTCKKILEEIGAQFEQLVLQEQEASTWLKKSGKMSSSGMSGCYSLLVWSKLAI